jgi:hypothetical protein
MWSYMLQWCVSVGHVQMIDNLIVLLLHSYIWKDVLSLCD